MDSLNIADLNTHFIFKSRPESIPGDLRPLWRIGVLLLILLISSRGGRSSFRRLQVLNWAILTRENQRTLIDVIQGKMKPDTVVVRIEPSLNRAVDLALGEGLVSRESNRISLTHLGQKVATILYNEANIFTEDKIFLDRIGKALKEYLVQQLLSGRH
jgi:hypothetical protein